MSHHDSGPNVSFPRGDARLDFTDLYVLGVLHEFKFTGHDFFADKDVCSIVLEVPNSALGGKEVNLWVRTLIQDEFPYLGPPDKAV